MLAIRAARLFDGESASLLTDATVLVDGDGRITAVGEVTPPAGYSPVDLGDVTLLPGLVDAHVHLVFDGSADPVARLAERDDDEVLEGMRTAARTALHAGITTVRDLGDRNYLALRLRDELAADPSAGPRVLAAGPPITVTRGHCWFLGGPADGVDGVRAAVRERAERGVDVIKMMTSGGEMTAGTHSHRPQYGVEEIRAAVDEAHRLGLPITAHAHATQSIVDCIAAGVDSIEHCSFMTEDGIDDRPDVIAAFAASGVVASLTTGMLPGVPLPPRIEARMPALNARLGQLYRAGVPGVASTDAGIGPAKPHDIMPYAVSQLVEAGWSTVDALRAGTSRAADLCRIDDRAGRLIPGLEADLLAVAGNPLDDPAALRDVRAVYRRGRRVR